MSLTQTLTLPDVAVPDTLDALDVSGLWSPSFPSPGLVATAAGMLPKSPRWAAHGPEGARPRITVGPGIVQVSVVDPARAERTAERALRARRARVDQEARRITVRDRLAEALDQESAAAALLSAGVETMVLDAHLRRARSALEAASAAVEHLSAEVAALDADLDPVRVIRGWSSKSRTNLVRTLASLDYTPLLGAGLPAMVTLTYGGRWQVMAPTAAVARAHFKALLRRYRRAWGRHLVGVWKREFQRRGAPHVHVHMVPPTGTVNGQDFRAWLASTWVDVVRTEVEARVGVDQVREDEWAAMHAVHAHAKTVDVAEGMRSADPRRLAVYFTKHGTFAAKEYQNEAPALWVAAGSVGRFWGVLGLSKALTTVEVDPAVQIAAARTLRRYSRANGGSARRQVWRARVALDQVDGDTGEVAAGVRVWRKRSVRRRLRRMPGSAGFITANDAPGLVSDLARYLDQVARS